MSEDSGFRTVRTEKEINELARHQTSDLARAYFGRTGRKSMKWLHYLNIYERYLSSYRGQPFRFLEIGVADGGSFQMWRQYFGPSATLFGIDIVPESRERVEELKIDAHVRIGSQGDEAFLRHVIAEMGGVDVVIDDGSHVAEHQNLTFRTLFPLLSDGGLYICEDLHTSYWEDWQGGYRRPGTFIEMIKEMIDSMHSWYHPDTNDLSSMKLHKHVSGVHMHDSMVVIEKNPVRQPVLIIT